MDSGSELLIDRWRRHAERDPDVDAVVHWRAGEAPIRWSRATLLARAETHARRLAADGVRAGDVCALMIRHHPEFHPLYAAIERIGAVPAVLAYPNPRLHPDKFRAGLAGMARHSGLDWLLTEKSLDPLVRPLALGADASVRAILHPLEEATGGESPPAAREIHAPRATDPCLLQHSSGTTGLQKGVMLSHRAVLTHVEHLARALAIRPDDRVVSWLPLYHDMGLIAAFHVPLALGIPTVHLDPFEWIAAPSLFLEAIAKERGTLAWLPNFAYNVMVTRVHDEDLEGLRFDAVRAIVNCSEPVRAASMRHFAARFAPWGLAANALGASYAMAETTFAVTQTAPGRGTRVLAAARDDLASGSFRPARPGEAMREVASSGPPIDGCTVEVLGEDGATLPDGGLGELVIGSDSMFDGYRNSPEKTAAVLREGRYWSGDTGFRWEGEIYVIGRRKDLIIVAGKNLYPEDLEDAIGEVEGVLPGRVVAFGVEDEASGTEQIWVVAESERTEASELAALGARVIAAGMGIDVTISAVHLKPPRWLVKSSAGKPSRSANRERVIAEAARSEGRKP